MTHEPLRITARLSGGVSLPGGPLAIDALLIWAEAQLRELPPLGWGEDVPDVPIELAKSACARFYLASFSLGEFEMHQRRFVNRKFPISEAQMWGDAKLTRVNISTGPQKSYRIPTSVAHAVDDTLTWFAIGDGEWIRSRLAIVTHLGKRRAVGRGKLRGWTVEPERNPWEGFPVVRNGKPLRPLPADWPGLVEPRLAMQVLAPPYWENWRAEMVASP